MLRPGAPWDSPHESPMHSRLAPRRYRAGGKFRTRHGRAIAARRWRDPGEKPVSVGRTRDSRLDRRQGKLRSAGREDRMGVGEGKSVCVRVELGGGRIRKKKHSPSTTRSKTN